MIYLECFTLMDLLVVGCNKRGVDVLRKFLKCWGGNKMGGWSKKAKKVLKMVPPPCSNFFGNLFAQNAFKHLESAKEVV